MALDAGTRAALGACIERLRPGTQGVGWVAEANLHITLKFLGAVDEARLDDIRAALARAAAGPAPFRIVIEGLGAFPAASRPRLIWAGVTEGRDGLTALAGRVEEQMAGLGFAPEARPFSAHVTLGRVRQPRRDARLEAGIARGGGQRFGAVLVENVHLMRSELSPRGSRYSELSSHPFA